MSVRPPLPPWLPPVLLGAAGAVAGLLLPGPAGSDPDLWVFSALNLSVGGAPQLPPGFPSLIRLGVALGLPPFDAAWWAAHAATPLVPALTWALARQLGARPGAALIAGLLPLLTASVLAFDAQVMPETWAASWFLACALAGVAFLGRPTAGGLAAVALLGAGAPLWREHGIAIALGLAGLVAVAPGRPGQRVLRAAGVLVGVGLLPVAFGGAAAAPWAQPWLARFGTMGLPNDVGAAIPHPTWMDRPAWALSLGGDAYLWAFLGLAACVRRDRRLLVPALVLAPGLGGLLVWSQPRHVAVVLPVAFAAWAAREGRGWRWLGGVVGAIALARSPFHLGRLVVERDHLEELRRFGEALCARVEPGDLAYGEPAAFLFCPLPRHEVDGSGADWKTWAVDHAPRGPGAWTQVDLGVGVYDVWRLAPRLTGDRRPCAASRADADTPYLASPPRSAVLVPPCDVPLPTEAEPAPRVRPRGRSPR